MHCDWLKSSKLMRSQEHVHLFHTVPVVTGTHSSTVCCQFYISCVFSLATAGISVWGPCQLEAPRHWPHWHKTLYILCGWLVVLHVGQTAPSESVKTALVQNKLQLLLSTKIVLVSELVLYWCQLGYITIHISTAECFCYWIFLL